MQTTILYVQSVQSTQLRTQMSYTNFIHFYRKLTNGIGRTGSTFPLIDADGCIITFRVDIARGDNRYEVVFAEGGGNIHLEYIVSENTRYISLTKGTHAILDWFLRSVATEIIYGCITFEKLDPKLVELMVEHRIAVEKITKSYELDLQNQINIS